MPAATTLPTTELLHQLFEYKDGAIYWRVARSGTAKKGQKAGCLNGRGYLVVGINFKKYLVHRIVWALHGNDPVPLIDHINGDKTDNRIENLRAATQAANMCNAKMPVRNRSGIKGVSWSKRDKCWVGSIWHENKLYKAGRFKCKNECTQAVRALRVQLHGEFARHD